MHELCQSEDESHDEHLCLRRQETMVKNITLIDELDDLQTSLNKKLKQKNNTFSPETILKR